MSGVHVVPGNGGGIVRFGSGSVVASLPRASIVPTSFTRDPHLVMIRSPHSPVAERYRRLTLRLEQRTSDDPSSRQLTVITSAVPGEGKTTTATNLALSYAENRKFRTLLVGADLRGPSVSRYLAPKPARGLWEVLSGDVPLDQALIETTRSKLWVLPEGAPGERPLEIGRTESLGDLIAELRRRFDRIVIDTPPTVPFTDASILASHADGVLLVVRARMTTTALIRRAWESLSGANVLGVVLNDVVFTIVDRYYSRYDESEPGRYAYATKSGSAA